MPGQPPTHPVGADAPGVAAYDAAYDALLHRWPAGTTTLDVPGPFGRTRVTAAGDPGGRPLVLLHAGGATGLPWYPVAAALAGAHRVYAVDQIGTGRSVPGGRPVRTVEDLMSWLDGLVDGLGAGRADLCGHSYGGWLALSWALRRPERVRRLALLDPTDCFAGLSLAYRARAVPLLVRPTPARQRRFLRWETRGYGLDEGFVALAAAGAGRPAARVVFPRRPRPQRLRTLDTPTLVLLAGRSRCHDPGTVARRAAAWLPHATVSTLPAASHHTLPLHEPAPLTAALAGFLA